MARPKKDTVDYFSHDSIHKKTLFIIKQKYKAAGYTFWFSLLEILGSTPNHFYNCSDINNWQYLISYTLIENSEKAIEVLNLLADLQAIDKELWTESKIIWSQNFVNRLKDLYEYSRHSTLPTKPKIITTEINQSQCVVSTDDNHKNGLESGVSTAHNSQSKVKESKGKYINIQEIDKFTDVLELDGVIKEPPLAAPAEDLKKQLATKKPKKPKHTPEDIKIHNDIVTEWQEKFGNFFDFVRESEGVYRLIKLSRIAAPDLPEYDFVLAARAEFINMKNAGHDLFTGKPSTPSMVGSSGLWPFVIESMKQKNLIRGSPGDETQETYFKRTMEGVFKSI